MIRGANLGRTVDVERDRLVQEFWKSAKQNRGMHMYSKALHHVLNLVEGDKGMFVPVIDKRQTELKFAGGACHLLVNGVRVLTLENDRVFLARHVGGVGLATDSYGRVIVEKE